MVNEIERHKRWVENRVFVRRRCVRRGCGEGALAQACVCVCDKEGKRLGHYKLTLADSWSLQSQGRKKSYGLVLPLSDDSHGVETTEDNVKLHSRLPGIHRNTKRNVPARRV